MIATDEWASLASDLRDGGVLVDEYLFELRHRGASIIDCIKAVRAAEGIRLGDAKVLVHESSAWADMRASIDALHAEIVRSIEDELA